MTERIAITLIATLGLVASAFLFGGRFELYAQGDVLWRLDRYTGTLSACGLEDQNSDVGCGAVVEGGIVTAQKVENATPSAVRP
jgi:hypothetical protein